MGFLRGLQDFTGGFAEGATAAMPQAFATAARAKEQQKQRDWEDKNIQESNTLDWISTATSPEELDAVIAEQGADSSLGQMAFSRKTSLWTEGNKDAAARYRALGDTAAGAGRAQLAEFLYSEAGRIQDFQGGFAPDIDHKEHGQYLDEAISRDRRETDYRAFWDTAGKQMLGTIMQITNDDERSSKGEELVEMLREGGQPGLAELVRRLLAKGPTLPNAIDLMQAEHDMINTALHTQGITYASPDYKAKYEDIRYEVRQEMRDRGIAPRVGGPEAQAKEIVRYLAPKSKEEKIKIIANSLMGSSSQTVIDAILGQVGVSRSEVDNYIVQQQEAAAGTAAGTSSDLWPWQAPSNAESPFRTDNPYRETLREGVPSYQPSSLPWQ